MMMFRWMYSVTLFLFTVQGELMMARRRTRQIDDGGPPRHVSISPNSKWIEQLGITRHRCIDEVCKSAATGSSPQKSHCLANCLHIAIQSSSSNPIVRKVRKTSIIDLMTPRVPMMTPSDLLMTPSDPRESEEAALSDCIRDQCSLADYQPQSFSDCVFEKCIGTSNNNNNNNNNIKNNNNHNNNNNNKHLFPFSTVPSRPQQFGTEGSGAMQQVSPGDQSKAWQWDPLRRADEGRDVRPVYNDDRSLSQEQLLASLMPKRGYSDATDICIAFHCSSMPRKTFGFLKCVNDNRCAGR